MFPTSSSSGAMLPSQPSSMSLTPSTNNDSLPKEIVLEIFSYLPIKILFNAQQVCRTWKAIGSETSLQLWDRLYKFHFPHIPTQTYTQTDCKILKEAHDNLESGKIQSTQTILTPTITESMGVSADGSRMVTLSRGGDVTIYDTKTNKILNTLPHAGSAIAISPDGNKIFAGNGTTLEIWDTLEGTLLKTEQNLLNSFIELIVFSSDGCKVVIAGSRQLKIFDLEIETEIFSRCFLPYGTCSSEWIMIKSLSSIAISTKKEMLLLATTKGNGSDLELWNYANNKLIAKKDLGGVYNNTFSFSKNGDKFAVGSQIGKVRVYETSTLKCLAKYKEKRVRLFGGSARNPSIDTLAFSPNDNVLIIGSKGSSHWYETPHIGRVTLWNINKQKILRRIEEKLPFKECFSENGRFFHHNDRYNSKHFLTVSPDRRKIIIRCFKKIKIHNFESKPTLWQSIHQFIIKIISFLSSLKHQFYTYRKAAL